MNSEPRVFPSTEISNHARPGHACLHNVNTWRMQAWAGFGPSAASQQGGWRSSNPADLAAWSEDVAHGRRGTVDRSALTPGQLVEDSLIFGLRMNDGVDLHELAGRWGDDAVRPFRPVLHALVDEGLATWLSTDEPDDRIALTRAGRLVADGIGGELIGAAR